MTSPPAPPLARVLRSLCSGAVHLPGEEGYAVACAVTDPGVPEMRPAAVIYPADEEEVAAAVLHLRRYGLRVLVQRTNRGAPPATDLDRVVVLRTSGLGGVHLDATTDTLRARAGALWSDVAAQAAAHGLSLDAPHDLTRGVVAGSVLPGPHGLPSAQVVAARAVLADGGILQVVDRSHDLLAALRAGVLPAAVVTELVLSPGPRSHSRWRSGTADDQPALTRSVREHLDPEGVFVLPAVEA